MPRIPYESLIEGDVLAKDVVVGDAVLFGVGTVLVRKFLDILKALGIKEVEIESRESGQFRNLKEVFLNIDKRFSYVDGKPFMMSIKYIIKDVAANLRGYR